MSAERWIVASVLLSGCFSPDAPAETDGGGADESSTAGTDPSGGPGATAASSTGQSTTTPSPTDPSDTDDPTDATDTDDPSDTDDPTDTGTPECGNGEVEAEEACDDGVNDGSYGGCNDDCTLAARCGDGEVQAAEACDDGDNVQGNGCNVDCVTSGSIIWTHVFVTQQEDLLDSPYFKEDGSPVVRAWNALENETRTLGGEDGSVVSTFDLPVDTVEVLAWGEDDGFIVREDTTTLSMIGDITLSRYSEDGVEQWRRVFENEVAGIATVAPGSFVALASRPTESTSSSAADRQLRSLSAGGNETWSDITAIDSGFLGYDSVVVLTNGTTLATNLIPTFLGDPSTIEAFNQGGGVTWTLEFEDDARLALASLDGGRWLARQGSTLEVRGPGGGVEDQAVFDDFAVDFALQAPNGDIVVAGTQSNTAPSTVARLSADLSSLRWSASPTDEDLPYSEVTGLAVGPNDEILVTARAYVVEAQGWDGWAVLIAP